MLKKNCRKLMKKVLLCLMPMVSQQATPLTEIYRTMYYEPEFDPPPPDLFQRSIKIFQYPATLGTPG